MFSTFRNATIGAAGCALAIGAAPAASAGVITYDTVAAFDAATTGLTSYAIPAPLPVGSTGQDVTPSITIGPVTFASSDLFVLNDGGYGIGQTFLSSVFAVETLTLSGATAIGFDLGTFEIASSFTASVNGGAPITVTTTAPNPAHQFFGITDTSPITSIVFSQPSPSPDLDILDFQVGSVVTTTTPEPASLFVLGAGILGLIASRRRSAQV
jgi:hypothetical protein